MGIGGSASMDRRQAPALVTEGLVARRQGGSCKRDTLALRPPIAAGKACLQIVDFRRSEFLDQRVDPGDDAALSGSEKDRLRIFRPRGKIRFRKLSQYATGEARDDAPAHGRA